MESTTKDSPKRKKRPILTALGAICVALFVLIVLVILFPAPILRYVLSRVETETGIVLAFDKAYFYLADGSFFYVEGLTAKRQNHSSMNLDLRAENVRIPAMVPKDFYAPILLITGLRGTVERVGCVADTDKHQEETASTEPFIHTLVLMDTEVNFIDRTLAMPFQATIRAENVGIGKTSSPALFEPYRVWGMGSINTALFGITHSSTDSPSQQFRIAEIPFDLISPYAPVLDDIFVSGSMNVQIDDFSNEVQKRIRVSIQLQPDCKIKPANEILVPALQTALRQLDQSSVSELQDVQRKIGRLKTSAESVRGKMNELTQIIDRLSFLAPRDVREEYERFRSQYDKATATYEEWNTKFETLQRELDHMKVRIIEDTFQAFIDSGVPIEIDLQEVKGEWQYDAYAVVIGLIEQNYRTLFAAHYQRRIQEIRDSMDLLLIP